MELDLIKVQWNVKDYAVDFIIPSKYDHIVLEHMEEIIDKMEFLTKALKDGTYPFGNIRGLGYVPEKKTLLTVDLKVGDFEEVKDLLLKQQERIEFLEKGKEEEQVKYRAVLHNADNGNGRIESIWFDTESEANRAGETGLKFYGGTHFTIEKQEK